MVMFQRPPVGLLLNLYFLLKSDGCINFLSYHKMHKIRFSIIIYSWWYGSPFKMLNAR